ncbi:MAG: heme exporter protein CcmD [Gammaproteobacteria bacterium]
MMGYFSSWSGFLEMGGHGFYVWLSYAIAALVVIYNVVSVRLKTRIFFKQAKRRLKREQKQL